MQTWRVKYTNGGGFFSSFFCLDVDEGCVYMYNTNRHICSHGVMSTQCSDVAPERYTCLAATYSRMNLSTNYMYAAFVTA